jgi:hypothetical protein
LSIIAHEGLDAACVRREWRAASVKTLIYAVGLSEKAGMFLPHFSTKSKATKVEGPPSLKRDNEAESRFDRRRNYCELETPLGDPLG